MNISQLPYILAISSTGSLSAAAKQLDISQPALSKYLKSLENTIGTELFFRNNGQYIPTPAGHAYINAAQQILSLSNHTIAAISALTTGSSSRIRLGISPNRGVQILAQIYPEFIQRYPDVEIIPTEGFAIPQLEQVQKGTIDILLATYSDASPVIPELEFIPSQKEELVLAVPSFHPAVKHRTAEFQELPFADLSEFRDSTFAIPSEQTSMYALIQRMFKEAHITPKVTHSVPNLVLLEAMVRSGMRIGVLPAYYVHPNSEIAYFRLKNPPILTSYYIFRKGYLLSEEERFLLFLITKATIPFANCSTIWNDYTRRLITDFSPVNAAAINLEDTQ